MQKLSLILGFVLSVFFAGAQQNPHGEMTQFSCTDCHTTEGWTFSASEANFNHDSTSFVLEGQHQLTDCKMCHISLVFSEVKST